jgi:hypothetical protein
MKKRLIHSSILILLAAASAFAEQPIKAQIPFPFYVGGSVLPSGSYTVDSGVARDVLRFRSADGKSTAMIVSHGVQPAAIPYRPKLVFNRYGDQYFLFQVWTGDNNVGHEVPRLRREKEVAAAAKRATETLLANK